MTFSGLDTFDLIDALASLIVAENGVDFLVERSNRAIKISGKITKLCDDFTGYRGQYVIMIRQDIWDLASSTGDVFGKTKA